MQSQLRSPSRAFRDVYLCFRFQKIGAIILVLMMAPKLSGDAVLGGHHLYVTPRTMTGIIRTTARKTIPRADDVEAGPSFLMATVFIAVAMKITACGRGSQSVKLILLFMEISMAYAGNPIEGANRADFLVSRHTFSARSASKILATRFICLNAGQS